MKKAKEKTIFSEMLRIVCLALFMTAAGIICLFFLNEREEDIYAEIVERNEITSCMHIVLGRMENRLDECGQEEEAQQEYEFQRKKLEDYMVRLYALSENRQSTRDTLIKIRLDLKKTDEDFIDFCDEDFPSDLKNAVEKQLSELKTTVQLLVVDDLQITKDEFVITLEKLNRLKACLAVGICLTMTVVYWIILRRILTLKKSVLQVTKYAERLSENQWNTPDMENTDYIEFQILGKTLDSLKHRTVDDFSRVARQNQLELSLEREKLANKQKDIQLVRTQLENLKRQINPHFLFNTLNIIGKSAMLKQTDQTVELIEAISRILRYSLEHENGKVTLAEDMGIIDDYLMLQKARFSEALCFEIDMADSTQDLWICPMLLQPLVENSIKHGFAEKEQIDILVSSMLQQEWLVLRVEDDGPGFAVKDSQESGIGLNNVRQRLSLEYGEDAEMTVRSTAGEGSVVELRIRTLRCTGENDENIDR